LVYIVVRCVLPSFSSFGWGVSEKIKMWKVNWRQTTDAKWWQKLTLPLARWANKLHAVLILLCKKKSWLAWVIRVYKTTRKDNKIIDASMDGLLLWMQISSQSINKHGRHRQFLFLIGLFLKIFSSETIGPNDMKLSRKHLPSDGKSSHCLWQGELINYMQY
jgi:hypothetical protein